MTDLWADPDFVLDERRDNPDPVRTCVCNNQLQPHEWMRGVCPNNAGSLRDEDFPSAGFLMDIGGHMGDIHGGE